MKKLMLLLMVSLFTFGLQTQYVAAQAPVKKKLKR